MVSPARTSVANWRVTSASPLRDSPGREKRSRRPDCAAAARMLSTVSGARPRSRSSDLAWRSVSASITPRVSRPVASSALYSKPDMLAVYACAPYSRLIPGSFPRNAQHFLETGFARAYPAPDVQAQALHAAAARVLAQVGLRGAVVDQAPGFVVDEQQLENPCAALIARERARLAAARGEQGSVRPAPIPVLEKGLLGAAGLVRAPARRAQPPHQPPGENAEPARGDAGRADAPAPQAHPGARRAGRVQARERPAPGRARLGRHLR